MKAVVLAGGVGSRMGGNKPFQPYGQTTLIEAVIARLKPQVGEIVVNAGTGGSALSLPLSCLGLRLIYDGMPGLGPLSGVLSALQMAEAAGDAAVVTAPCDMPELPVDMVAQLGAADSDVVYFSGVRDYPLCALWRVSVLPALRAALEAADGGLPVMRFLDSQTVACVTVTDETAFVNVNRP